MYCTWTDPSKYNSQWQILNDTSLLTAIGDYFPPKEIINIINSKVCDADFVYLKGVDKVQWINDKLYTNKETKIINLDSLGCPSIDVLQSNFTSTSRLRQNDPCCAKNVYLFKFWKDCYDMFQ